MANADTAASDVFIYKGSEAGDAPQEVIQINVDPSVKEIHAWAFTHRERLSKAQLPEGLEIIGPRSFLYCRALEHLSIPSSVTTIGSSAFARMASLLEMHLPEGIEVVALSLFGFCTSLRTLGIPSSVIEIKPSAFVSCSSLVAVDIPDGLQILGEKALMGCESLTRVRIPSMIKVIKHRTFGNCKRILSVELPEDVQTIENKAFLNARDLRNIFFGSLTRDMFHADAFIGCAKLKELFPEEDNDERLLQEVESRFNGLPIHRLCYFQSYHSITETMAELQKIMSTSPSCGADLFGMTPFHILALSTRPNIEIFQALVNQHRDVLTMKDRWGSDALGYACTSPSANGTEIIKFLLLSLVHTRVESLGLERWRADITSDIVDFPESTDCESRLDHVRHLASKLSKYLTMEKISLLESAIWKAKIDESVQSDMIPTSRETFRLICGAEIVISNVLPYLGPPPKLEDLDFDREL